MVVPYLATADAGLVLEVRRGAKRVARLNGRARPGANTIAWAPKRGGRYALRLVATSAQGATARAGARVRVVRR